MSITVQPSCALGNVSWRMNPTFAVEVKALMTQLISSALDLHAITSTTIGSRHLVLGIGTVAWVQAFARRFPVFGRPKGI